MDETSGFDIERPSEYDNNYRILRLVHESKSGFCRILEVKHAGRLYIAKALKPQYRKSKIHLDLLKKEDDILSTLYHPAIIQTFGIHEIEGEGPCLILEYAHGVTLQSYIDSGEITAELATGILTQICSAIEYCHQREIIHRDLKPSNIVVHPESSVIKIIDFNFSHSPSYTDLPLPGGTTNFSAPEQFEQGCPALPSSDIWSIGKIMQEMLPKGSTNWKRVSDLCMSVSPQERPASAKLIPQFLNKSHFLKKSVIGSLIIIIALFLGFFIFNYYQKLPGEKADNITANLVSDSIQNIADPKEDNDILNNALQDNAEINDSKEKEINASITESPEIINGKTDKDITPNNQPVILSAQLLAEAKKRAEEVASKRFKEQLSILDTAESCQTIFLAKVNHWRWLAKQDMSKWIKAQKLTKTEEKEMAETVSNIINEYDKEHSKELKKALHDAFFYRRVIWVANPPETLWEYVGNDEYERKVLGEDGVWHKQTRKGKPQD